MKSKTLPSQEALRQKFTYAEGHLFRDGQRVGTTHGNGYLKVTIRKVPYYVHRLIWAWHHGAIPEGMEIDHIDGSRDNNKIENLRLATRGQQNHNKAAHKNCISGLKGAHYNGDRCRDQGYAPWHSQIRIQGKLIYLGQFWTAEEAHAAYVAAAKEHCGGYSRVAA